jgi:hypothetical protein
MESLAAPEFFGKVMAMGASRPRATRKWEIHPDIRVMVRNAQGQYLAQDSGGVFFTGDRSRAAIFDLEGDQVEEQLSIIRETEGEVLLAEPVPLEELYERCDRCKDVFTPLMILFDGKRFLCADCRNAVRSRRRAV